MQEKAKQLKEQFTEKVNSATATADLEQLRIEFLGKKGPISSLMGELRNIPNEQKKEAGQIINDVKQFIEATIAAKKDEPVAAVRPAAVVKEAPKKVVDDNEFSDEDLEEVLKMLDKVK